MLCSEPDEQGALDDEWRKVVALICHSDYSIDGGQPAKTVGFKRLSCLEPTLLSTAFAGRTDGPNGE